MTALISKEAIKEFTELLIDELESLSDTCPQESVKFVEGMIDLANDPNFQYADWSDSEVDLYLGPSLALKDELHFAWKKLHKLLDNIERNVKKAKREYKCSQKQYHSAACF